MEAPARTNYIFVDYENVQQLDLDLVAGKAVKVFLVVGAQRKNLPLALSKQILKHHDQVQLIESDGASRNALDLVLAYHVGAAVKADPEGYFHILAKDKDYDALIQHLQADKILASRREVFEKIPALIDMRRLSLGERVDWVMERLKKNQASRPTRRKTLLSNIHAFCRKELTEAEVLKIFDTMVQRKMITVTPPEKIAYSF